MDIVISILLGAGRALGCFSLLLGAVLIFHYADGKSRSHEHNKYESIMLLVTAIACLFPAYEMYDGVLSELSGAEKASFIAVAILCAISFFCILTRLPEQRK